MQDRMCVFIDYQNTYMRAREAFGDESTRSDFTFGQVMPRGLAVRLMQMAGERGWDRSLTEVRVYRGEPDAGRNRQAQAACQRQIGRWSTQEDVVPLTRPLAYRRVASEKRPPVRWEAREKGIDVMIAVDMVVGALTDAFDVAVLMSADTDLLPAAEAVVAHGKWMEFAAWHPDQGYASHLRLRGGPTWCHQLRRNDFDVVADSTDYTKPLDGGA